MNELRRDPLWFRVLDRFGAPTLVVVFLLGFGWRQSEADRAERRELVALLGGLRTVIAEQTRTLEGLASAERAHADAVTATWPRLRFPRVASAAREPAAIPDPEGSP